MRTSPIFRLMVALALNTVALGQPVATPESTRPKRLYTIEQFLATTAISRPAISSDGSKVLFTSDASGIPNVQVVPFGGGKIEPLTKSTVESTYGVSWFPKDDRILFTHDQGGDEQNHLYVLAEGKATDLTPGPKLKAMFIAWSHDDKAFFVETNERDPRYFDVYRYDAATYKRTLLYENTKEYSVVDISGDGRFISLEKPTTTSDNDLYLWDTEGRSLIHLSPHTTPAAYHSAAFDPDAKWFYYVTDEKGEFSRLMRYQMATGQREEVESADWDIAFTQFSHNGRFRVTAINQDGATMIRLLDTKSGRIVPMPSLPAGDVTAIVFSRDETRMVISLIGDRSPLNLYSAIIGNTNATRLTDSLSKEIDADDLVDSRVVRFKASDGMSIPSIFFKPLTASPTHKVPALVWVHGGPGGQTRKGYSALIQYLVNHGYAVLGINNRGSSGYGRTYFRADDKKHGHEPLRDCVEAKNFLASMNDIDSSRIGIIGGSYGGYMVLAALAFQPEEFVVGVDIFGVSNWLRTLESIPLYWEANRRALYEEIGDPAKDRDMLKAISPVFHADNIKRPLMVLQGKNDPRVLKSESDDIVSAVKASGVPVEYIVFDNEGHGFTKKKNQVEGYGAVLQFLDKYLKGATPADSAAKP